VPLLHEPMPYGLGHQREDGVQVSKLPEGDPPYGGSPCDLTYCGPDSPTGHPVSEEEHVSCEELVTSNPCQQDVATGTAYDAA
jgi:hypothetical protein